MSKVIDFNYKQQCICNNSKKLCRILFYVKHMVDCHLGRDSFELREESQGARSPGTAATMELKTLLFV